MASAAHHPSGPHLTGPQPIEPAMAAPRRKVYAPPARLRRCPQQLLRFISIGTNPLTAHASRSHREDSHAAPPVRESAVHIHDLM